MTSNIDIENMWAASQILKQGGIIAYPTEGVYGFGCDPLNQAAVMRLLEIKQRKVQKGLILVAESWSQLAPYINPFPKDCLERIKASPSNQPITWVFPAKPFTPNWIKGDYTSIAVRVSAHPVIQKLCQEFGGAIVSTSANIQGQTPALTYEEVFNQFDPLLDNIIKGNVGSLGGPTPIRDALTGEVLRT